MRIAVDTRSWQSDEIPGLRNFTREVFSRLASQHKDVEFLFLIESGDGAADLPKNVTTVILSPRQVNFLLHLWLYNVTIPYALRRYKADLFIATNGFASLTTSTKQLLIVRDPAFLQKKTAASQNASSYYKRYMRQSIKRARRIATLSDFTKEALVNHYQVGKEEIQSVGCGIGASFKPVDWEEREAIKNRFAEGCEYFVVAAVSHAKTNLLNVLKAFSIFKKWQKTNMKLAIVAEFDEGVERDFEKLKSYKYRSDVVIKQGILESEMATLVAGAYAMIFPSSYESFGAPVLEAMKCEVPVITSPHNSMSEIAADAGLYADPASPEDLAGQMKKIFKDEQLRIRLIEAGKERSGLYSWDKTAMILWNVVEQALSG